MAAPPPAVPTATTPYVGVVKSFNPAKGWGHIECEDTFKLFGKDIFLLRSRTGSLTLARGSQVTFTVEQGTKGPEAANVQLVQAPESRFRGTVKSWNPQRGWGHIECAATQEVYGKDIFLMRSALVGGQCNKGDEVSFDIIEGSKGPEACGVQVVTAPVAAPDHPRMGYVAMYQAPQYDGVIAHYNAALQQGSIHCPQVFAAYGCDVAVTGQRLGSYVPQAGDQITFGLAISQDGRPEALNVQQANSYQAERSHTGLSWAKSIRPYQ
ncbi:cspLA [Symbiodinium natans]|uniref:CspLA protein n=1 Tax=Symbiodinium natans TaxID=878477 RepID=A0A812MSH2_9DINO|nr:cspLA [Symbiodinium natans]